MLTRSRSRQQRSLPVSKPVSTPVKKTNSKKKKESPIPVPTPVVAKPIDKQFRLWVPHDIEQDDQVLHISVYMEDVLDIPKIDNKIYNNNFREFHSFHMKQYNKNKNEFCYSYKKGGVSEDYLVDSANDDDSITLMIVSVDDADMISNVYALITFRYSTAKDAIKVKTLCGNQVLAEAAGDAGRLLSFLEQTCVDVGYYNIILDPLDTVVNYYTKKNYVKILSKESRDSSYSSRSSSSGSSSSGSSSSGSSSSGSRSSGSRSSGSRSSGSRSPVAPMTKSLIHMIPKFNVNTCRSDLQKCEKGCTRNKKNKLCEPSKTRTRRVKT